jgi:hypothetical protein
MLSPKILLDGDERLRAFREQTRKDSGPAIVGWREWTGLPALGIARIRAKIDTGARTSALHANAIESFERDGIAMLRFDVVGEGIGAPAHEAAVADRRSVRSSNGEAELRFVLRTELALAGTVWPIEITLTNRERMELPMLIGREALAGHVLVDAGQSWLWGRPVWRRLRLSRKSRPGEQA